LIKKGNPSTQRVSFFSYYEIDTLLFVRAELEGLHDCWAARAPGRF
jgi:hypothetical protein